ncbi:hypothetical protein SETIT_1G365800v2 [Setaria italica]|uniref:C2 NT-type domain-containing protein n=2 Tax=Setaria italica TaxID=4555 RepID=A0A368PT13_SETIT|nr:uncharacterized protein LOC111258172 [Setaria italica]RCV08927.1 hypothetical protein SETIT_1G365800v2 [Setaria italica]
MVGKPQHHHHGSSSLGAEELNLLHMARGSPDGGGRGGGESRGALGQWKCRLLGSLGGLLPRRARCVVCLQVQHVTGLPPAAEGRGVVVGWRSKGGEGEHTAPARVARGAAAFDEVFLHHFSAGGATLRSFTVWAALLDSPANGDLGAFPVDLTEVAAAETFNPKFGGKVLSFPLGGAAAGAVLTVSIYCRVMEPEESHGANGHAREKMKNKGKGSYASCLPDLSCLRNRQVAAASGSARRATSIRSDRGGFITIENSVAEMDGDGAGGAAAFRVAEDVDEEGAGFITMEKGTVSSRSRRPPLPDAVSSSADEEDEKPCLFMELSEEAASVASAFDVDKVEDEFLAMLEDKYWARSKEIEKGLSVSLDIGLDLGLDLDSLIKDAEMELAKAEQRGKSKVGAAIVEEEEYKSSSGVERQGDHYELPLCRFHRMLLGLWHSESPI